MSDTPVSPDNWERKTLEKLVLSVVQEQRKTRNWGVFFKLMFFVWVFLLLAMGAGWINKGDAVDVGPHTAVISLRGVIDSSGDARAERLIEGLRDAFKNADTRAVVLRANSPGGSPVQSAMVYDEILRLRKLYPKIAVYAVVEDVCASGCYYVAAAADRIYVSQASLIGSIGVLMDGFGFTGTMDKLGIERRLITAGTNKGFLDPFSPMSQQQVDYARTMLGEIHQQFITAVKQGRGTRLKDNPELFSGLVWSGVRGVEMGLADEFGTVDSVARDVVKAQRLVDFTPEDDLAERFAKRLGAGVGSAFLGWMDRGLH